jgi:archaellum component FlaC
MADISKDEIRERLGNIDQIRDIIFGAHLREYNSRLEKLENQLAESIQDIRERNQELKAAFTTELRASLEAIDKRLKTISNISQEETADLRQQVDRLNRKFSSSLEQLDETVAEHKMELHDEIADTRDKLQFDIRELKNFLLEELDRHVSMMQEVKVSKDDMAELLFELGMRLKGKEFAPELRQVANVEVDQNYSLLESVADGSAESKNLKSDIGFRPRATSRKLSMDS